MKSGYNNKLILYPINLIKPGSNVFTNDSKVTRPYYGTHQMEVTGYSYIKTNMCISQKKPSVLNVPHHATWSGLTIE